MEGATRVHMHARTAARCCVHMLAAAVQSMALPVLLAHATLNGTFAFCMRWPRVLSRRILAFIELQ